MNTLLSAIFEFPFIRSDQCNVVLLRCAMIGRNCIVKNSENFENFSVLNAKQFA